MKYQKVTERGFSAIAGVVVVLVLAVIGLSGWIVYDKQKDQKQETKDTAAVTNKPADDNRDKNIPEGFILYKSAELGLQFAYPKAWGDVYAKPGAETDHLVAGAEHIMTFSGNTSVTAGLRTLDWKHDENLGHDGEGSATSYTDTNYEEYVKSPGESTGLPAVTYHKDSASFIISTVFAGIGCDGVGELLVNTLEGSKKYSGIAFMYLNKKFDSASTLNKETGRWSNGDPYAICEDDEYKKYISAEHGEELKKVNSTIAALE